MEMTVGSKPAERPPFRGKCRRCGKALALFHREEMCVYCAIWDRYAEGEEPPWNDDDLRIADRVAKIETALAGWLLPTTEEEVAEQERRDAGLPTPELPESLRDPMAVLDTVSVRRVVIERCIRALEPLIAANHQSPARWVLADLRRALRP